MSTLIDDLLALRDGNNDILGHLIGRTVGALRRAARIKKALASLIDAHDQIPSQLTAREWRDARKALGWKAKRTP